MRKVYQCNILVFARSIPLLLLGVFVQSDTSEYATLGRSTIEPAFDQEHHAETVLLPTELLGFVELSQVPHLKTSGVYEIINDDDYNAASQEAIRIANAFGNQTTLESREKTESAASTMRNNLRFAVSARASDRQHRLWNGMKAKVPHLQAARLSDLIHWNRRLDKSDNGTGKSPSSPENNLALFEKSVSDIILRLLPLAITNAIFFKRITPALGGYIFGKVPQLLLPLYLAQRSYRFLYLVGRDWYTGRYLRLQFERMERQYRTRYRIPECTRSICRFFAHLLCLCFFGYVLKFIINVSSVPCKSRHGGWNAGYGVVWLVSVLGAGHAAGVAIAIWGGPLQIQVDDLQRPSLQNMKRPMRLLRWILDPDKWFRDIIARDHFVPTQTLKPFNPDAVLFPATWSLLRALQMIAVVQHMQGPRMNVMMRKIVLQQALNDEWYRVLMCEKRVAWAIVFMGLFSYWAHHSAFYRK